MLLFVVISEPKIVHGLLSSITCCRRCIAPNMMSFCQIIALIASTVRVKLHTSGMATRKLSLAALSSNKCQMTSNVETGTGQINKIIQSARRILNRLRRQRFRWKLLESKALRMLRYGWNLWRILKWLGYAIMVMQRRSLGNGSPRISPPSNSLRLSNAACDVRPLVKRGYALINYKVGGKRLVILRGRRQGHSIRFKLKHISLPLNGG